MNLKSLTEISKYSKGIFVISVIIFLLSLIPVSYTAGYSNGLSGGAGIGSEPTEPMKEANPINYYVAAFSGAISSLALATSAFTSAQRARIERRTEEMKYKTSQLQYEMQMKEIEILRMELEAEKIKKRNKRSSTSNQQT